MNDRTEHRSYRELDDDERYYATAPIDEIRRELEHHGVRMEPAIAAVRALIDERTPRVRALIERTPRVRATSARTVFALNPETTYLQHLDPIGRIAAYIAYRNHLTADETEEFSQVVRVRLFEDDYAIIRKFEGRSSLTTYLTTVIMRLFHQWRVELWGKWRPSAKARALGVKAITLERLLSDRTDRRFDDPLDVVHESERPHERKRGNVCLRKGLLEPACRTEKRGPFRDHVVDQAERGAVGDHAPSFNRLVMLLRLRPRSRCGEGGFWNHIHSLQARQHSRTESVMNEGGGNIERRPDPALHGEAAPWNGHEQWQVEKKSPRMETAISSASRRAA